MLARALFAAFLLTSPCFGQAPPANGPITVDPAFHALVGGTAIVRPGARIERATIVLRHGRIVSVTSDGAAPTGARVFDCTGLTLYPSLIEPFLPVDAPAPDADAPLVHWHPMVQAQRSALDGDGTTADDRRSLRALGFGAAAIAPTGGVCKGSAAVVLLDEPGTGERATVVRAASYQLCSVQARFGGHPGAEMGAIALLRQTLADADWHERCALAVAADPTLAPTAPPDNLAVRALVAQRALPLAFDVEDELQVLRGHKIAAEFGRKAFAIGSGMEFRRVQAIAAAGLPVVVPVHFPDAPEVATVAARERVSLRQLQSWEHAPTNLRRLLTAKVEVALTTARLPDRSDFRARLHEALAFGVDRDQTLAALTTVPARLLGVERDLGTLEPGRIANITAVDGDLFDPKARIDAIWVGGHRHSVQERPPLSLPGRWSVTGARTPAVAFELDVGDDDVKATIAGREQKATKVARAPDRLEFVLDDEAFGNGQAWCRLHLRNGQAHGEMFAVDGTFPLVATRVVHEVAAEPRPGQPDARAPDELAPLPLPLGGYGQLEPPPQRAVVFTGATLWTSADAGIVPLGALFVRDGKIVYAGPRENLPATGDAEVIDCTGKHITPGLIDCHSHTGISRGINEGGEAVTAEVRVQDVVNPDDVSWYRQLAGGVTAVNQLHGSANAIGGQSNTVKLRWGCQHPDEMLFLGSVPGIKFALGENPRRANSSDANNRYPNTRMGVEALIRDRFHAAADYRRRLQTYDALPPKARAAVLPPRRDLELEALAEILAGTRRVHCHSYRQDEIFMLCGIAKEFGFRIGTFQHVLEGYKVAEAIRDAAVGASAFSDWWAYKFEVYDAIPENGAILHEAGVCVSFNSDSDEHARRLNTEAGKAVRYGGVAKAAALQFVTRNPAVQLGIEQQTGSLQRGLDADLAIWSADPLSYQSVCESTWVDGREYFSRARDRELRLAIAKERERLLRKALVAAPQRSKDNRNDARDAYWRAEDLSEDYCCRDCEGGRR